MSTANSNNCHVSTTSKWEDTGGNLPKPSDCDDSILLNAVDCTNDLSLQELIENELALRSSTASTNTVTSASNGDCKMNGDRLLDEDEEDATTASEDLICDTEHDDFVANENRKNLSRNCLSSSSSSPPPVKTNNRDRTVDEVDDFETLYKEVSSGEGIANGLSILVDPFESVSEATTLSESSVKNGYEDDDDDHDSNATELPQEAINTVVLDSLETDATSSRSTEENLIDVSETDFVAVSAIRAADGGVNEPKVAIHGSAVSNSPFVDNDDNEWIRVEDAVSGEEGVRCAATESDETPTDGDESAIEERQRSEVDDVEAAAAKKAPRIIDSGAHEPEVVVLSNDDIDDYLSYGDAAAEQAVNDGAAEKRNGQESRYDEDETTATTLMISGAKLIEECSFSITRDCVTNELVLESNSSVEKKTVKKKKNASEESVTTTKTKKTKKTKKYDEKENISVRSGFGKFDQLTKKSVMQVRSSDPTKAQQHNSQSDGVQDSGSICKACNKNVFAMEQIKAERHVWHKNCFRCKTCNKQLTVDIYSSHEGELYCKPHFRDLFKPKVVVEEEKPASDKPDLGLEELGSLNVKSRFQVFEKQQVEEQTDKSPICVKRSPSILSKLAKFQAKGMNIGVSSDEFNGIEYEESSSSEEEPAQNDNVTKSSVTKEKPIAFNKMNDVKKNWENGQASRREERLEERRQEKQNIRSRLFMGKQNKMREAYENAVAESERNNVRKDVEVKSEKARSIKEKFEKGESLQNDDSDEDAAGAADKKTYDDSDVFEAGISKKSRSIFQQMDAAIKTQTTNHTNNYSSSPQPMQNGHARPRKESESPERDTTNKNTDVVRCDDQLDENEVLKKSNTTAKMLSLFRQLEEAQETVPDGPKPMKKFTPPPMSNSNSEGESEEESEETSEASVVHDDVIRASDKTEDEYLKMAQQAAKAKSLREKFEKWEPEKQSNNNAISMIDSEQASLDTTKSLRARFESMKAAEQQVDKPRPKVNRFVDKSLPGYCDTCMKKVYPLEKVEAGDKVFHRSCFKCTRCSGILRMETFTMNNGHLYCVPHFKQLFITKGNYDEGFGNNQHKSKWPVHTGVTVANGVH